MTPDSAVITASKVDARPAATAVEGRSALYRAVWRWHFYAGLFAIPILVILCLSGIVYLFRPEVHALFYGDLLNVKAGTDSVSYEQQLTAVQAKYPDMEVVQVITPASPTRSTAFELSNGETTPGFASGNYTAYVDPYTGEVLGRRNNHQDPVQIANEIHGSLLTRLWLGDPKWGDRVVELAASWTAVLVVTGVYLWWPRGRAGRSLKGTLIPRFNLRGARIKWRDIHAITGVLFSFVFLFFVITGLAWSGLWGANYARAVTAAGADTVFTSLNETPSSKTLSEEFGEGAFGWAAGSLPVLPSNQQIGAATATNGQLTWAPREGAPLDAIVASAQQAGVPHGFRISLPSDPEGTYVVGYGWRKGEGVFGARTAYLDQYTAEVLTIANFNDFGLNARLLDGGIGLHEGDEWGLFGQLLALIGTLAVLVSLATSVVMWAKRRPKGLGAPRRVSTKGTTLGLAGVTLTMGVLFPMVGLSIIALVIFDFVVLRHVRPLGRALSY